MMNSIKARWGKLTGKQKTIIVVAAFVAETVVFTFVGGVVFDEDLTPYEEEIASLESEVDTTSNSLTETEDKLIETEAALTGAEAQVVELTETSNDLETKLLTAEATLEVRDGAVAERDAEISELESTIADYETVFSAEIEALPYDIAEAAKRVRDAEYAAEQERLEAERLEQERIQAEQERVQAEFDAALVDHICIAIDFDGYYWRDGKLLQVRTEGSTFRSRGTHAYDPEYPTVFNPDGVIAHIQVLNPEMEIDVNKITSLWKEVGSDCPLGGKGVIDSGGEVGVDIPVGTWNFTTSDDGCYWERSDGAGNIIANNFSSSPIELGTINVRSSDYWLEFDSDCGTAWRRSHPIPTAPPAPEE
jgi:hypothetical protein